MTRDAGRGAICVFAKVPRPGRVKTRLARTRGDDVAAALAEAFLEDTVTPLLALDATLVLAFDEAPPERWRASPVITWLQGEGGLGERLERVLARALETHPFAIALGADSPGLPRARVERAIAALSREGGPNAALGPCEDGGYYLLGVRALPPGTLRAVRFSTPHALDDTARALAEASGHAPFRLEPWFDVDEEADLVHLEALLGRGAVDAPATARLLRGRA